MRHFCQLIQDLGRPEICKRMLPEWVFVDTYCVMPEPRVKILFIATRPYSAILDSYAVNTELMKRSENNSQLTVGRWKFNLLW